MEVGLGGPEAAMARLLWEAGRPQPRVDEVRSALDAGAGQRGIAGRARRQGLAPMLWRALGAAGCRDRIEPDDLAKLEHETEVRRGEGLLLVPHALKLSVGQLGAKGFEPVVFKGPALAARYPEAGLRSMEDIDLLLPAADHAAALQVLVAAGWDVARGADRLHYDTTLYHPSVPGLCLEVHRGLDTWYDRSTSVRADALWRRRVPIDCFGTPAFGLPAEEEVLALAAHAGKPFHCFSRLIWIVDLVVVAEALQAGGRQLDWGLLGELAQAWRCQTMLAVALAQASRLGLEPPAELTRVGGSSVRRAALAPLFDPGWPLAPPEETTRNRLRYALVDGWARRAVLFAGTAPTVRSIARLSWADLPRLVQVTLLLAAAELAVRLRPLPTVSRWFGSRVATATTAKSPVDPFASLPRGLRRRLYLLDRVARRWPAAEGPCLRRALAEGFLLRRYHPELRLGVARRGEGVLGHAWVEVSGHSLDDHSGFAPFRSVGGA